MKGTFSFNKIFVIESLSKNDTKTGQNLHDDLLRWKIRDRPDISVDLRVVDSREAFLAVIKDINRATTTDKISPFIHLEIHGSRNKDGLVISNGELVTWLELVDRLREINIVTQNNLFLSLATCYGAHIYGAMRFDKEAPFWGFVASWGELESYEIEVSFTSFFDTLFGSFDFNLAIKNLNEANELGDLYRFYMGEQIFENVFNHYRTQINDPEKRSKRIEALLEVSPGVKRDYGNIDGKSFIEENLDHFFSAYILRCRKVFLMGK